MTNPLLGKVFSLPNLTSYQKIILWQIIYDKDVYRDELAEKASCTPKTVTETLKFFKEIGFLFNYDTSTRKQYDFDVNYTGIDQAWASRSSATKKTKGKRKVKRGSSYLPTDAKLESPVLQNSAQECDIREPGSPNLGAPFPKLGSPVHTSIYEYINKINKLNTNTNSEITPESEEIYLFSCDNNISEEDVIIEDQANIEHHVSCKTEEAKQNGIIIVEQLTPHASNTTNLSPKMQIIISKIQGMRRNGDIPANIASKTDQTLSAEAAIHVKDQINKGFTFDQALRSFQNLVKKGLFQTPNSMQKHINEHERIKTEKENLQKSLITDERTLKISSEKKSQEEIISCKEAAKNAFDLMSKCLPGFKSKTNNSDGLKLVVSNAKDDAKVNPELTNKTFVKPRTNRLIDSSSDEARRKLLEEQMKEFARLNPELIAL